MGENAPTTPPLVDLSNLPSSDSPSLTLTHPTPEERLETWKLNSKNWGTSLSLPDYLARENYLLTVPLAKDSGITHWVLVASSSVPNNRPILASCESLRKPCLVAKNGQLREGITHGIGSVFSNPLYRGKGYASRMMKEVGEVLKHWQEEEGKDVPFSILYSDIGKKYYARMGWKAYPSTHISFPASTSSSISTNHVKPLTKTDLPALCAYDEETIHSSLTSLSSQQPHKTHVSLLPSYEQIQWHHLREKFVSSKIFSRSPAIHGAIVGSPGSRIWAIWTRAWYGPLIPSSGNTLHILRLVIENPETDRNQLKDGLRNIIDMAKHEAKEWSVNEVDIWNPTSLVRGLVREIGGKFEEVDREEESIASLYWYGVDKEEEIVWENNDKFGWC